MISLCEAHCFLVFSIKTEKATWAFRKQEAVNVPLCKMMVECLEQCFFGSPSLAMKRTLDLKLRNLDSYPRPAMDFKSLPHSMTHLYFMSNKEFEEISGPPLVRHSILPWHPWSKPFVFMLLHQEQSPAMWCKMGGPFCEGELQGTV